MESKYRNYYFNDRLKVGAVLYGDMDLSVGGGDKTKVIGISGAGRKVLARFGVRRSDSLLFASISSKYSVVGLIRNAATIKVNDFQQVIDRKDSYLMKTLNYKNREAYEGLIPLDSSRFLSIIDYADADRENAKEGFHTIMFNSFRRIKSGEALLAVLDPFEDADELFDEHGYLAPYKLALNKAMYKEQPLLNQALATYYSFSGDQESARKLEESFIGFKKETIKAKDLAPAAAAILRRTLNQKAVMFNTAHHRPEHAYFLGQLLDSLRHQGFTHLGLEGLADSSSAITYGFITQSDGFYTRDPELSNLISKAIALGFQLVSYDDDSENREHKQAENLVSKTFKKDKNARVVVLAGYAHIDEIASPKKMAAYFKDFTGIDPLTIDQTRLMTSECDELDSNYKDNAYVYLAGNLGSGMNILLWNNISLNNKPIGTNTGMPPVNVKVEFPVSLQLKAFQGVEMLYRKADFLTDSTAVPLHVKLVPADARNVTLNLYPGKYVLQILGDGKEVLYQQELVVK